MKRTAIHGFTLLALLAGFWVSAPHAYGDTLNLTLLDPVQYARPGVATTLSFDATVTAPSTNTGTEFLNGDSFATSVPLDDTGYFTGFPLSLSPGQNFTGLLFTILVGANTLPGGYTGSFTITGGSTDAVLNNLATVAFDVFVTPEPSTFVLFSTGVGLLMGCWWWRRRSATLPSRARSAV